MSRYLSRPSDELLTRERCHVRELLNESSVPGASLARCRVEAGITTELHRLSVAEWYFLRQGQGRMEISGEPPFAVGPGDVVAIPAGLSQRIRNTGDVDLLFDCLCIPRFTQVCYEPLEDDAGTPPGVG